MLRSMFGSRCPRDTGWKEARNQRDLSGTCWRKWEEFKFCSGSSQKSGGGPGEQVRTAGRWCTQDPEVIQEHWKNGRLTLGCKLFCGHSSKVATLLGGAPGGWRIQRGEPTDVKGVSENIHTSGKPWGGHWSSHSIWNDRPSCCHKSFKGRVIHEVWGLSGLLAAGDTWGCKSPPKVHHSDLTQMNIYYVLRVCHSKNFIWNCQMCSGNAKSLDWDGEISLNWEDR